MKPMLHVTDLRKRYGNRVALDGVDLAVAPGEVLGLLGPNGAGKTTLVSIVAGLRKPDAGEVRVGEWDALRHPRQAHAHIGLAPQELGIYPPATVRENLRFFGGLAGLSARQLRTRVEEVAAAMGLGRILDQRAQTLSGGQKRRLHAAAAMLHRPPLLLLDEPTVGADVETRAMLLEVVSGLADEGAAVVYTTHYLHELDVLDATVAIIEHGRLIARGSREELTSRHGVAAVELTFEGPVPDPQTIPPEIGEVVVADSTLRISASDPATAAARALAALAATSHQLRSVEIVRPGLEAVYLALTGRRSAEEDAKEVADVAA
jgi:ABC-2 type transport system ATP-binding protein